MAQGLVSRAGNGGGRLGGAVLSMLVVGGLEAGADPFTAEGTQRAGLRSMLTEDTEA